MKTSEAVKKLKAQAGILQEMGAQSLYLFGSTAEGKARPDSDLDLYLEPSKTRSFSLIDLVQMRAHLEQSLQSKVDLTTRKSLHPMLRRSITESAIKIF